MDRQQQETAALAAGWSVWHVDGKGNPLEHEAARWVAPWEAVGSEGGPLPSPDSADWALDLERLFVHLGYGVVISDAWEVPASSRVRVTLETNWRHRPPPFDAPVVSDSILEALNGILLVLLEVRS